MVIRASREFGPLISVHQKGVTLVELIIALSMSAIVMAGIMVIVSGSNEFIIKGRNKNRLQQDFSLIDLVLATNIRQGNYGEQKLYNSYADYMAGQPKQSSGSCIKLYFPSGDSCMFYKDNMDFKIQQADLTITNLVPGVVDSINFTEKTNYIQTYVTLNQGGQTITSDINHAFRNIGSGLEILRPMGSGAYSKNNSNGCSSNWQCVDEATSDGDGTYVKGKNNNNWKTDTYATEDGSGASTINSVVVYIRVRSTRNNRKTRTVIRISGTRYYGQIINLNGVTNYTTFFTKYSANPHTSAPWTWAEINAMEIGVRFKRNGRCTQVWAEVYRN